ncbi:MAG: phenazine biosynthesis protein PhzF [Rickettsiales bacterium]|nr:phenazine biosynthesis protein PhzF [Rickettsiales bacterium]
MNQAPYFLLDVFTEKKYGGNQLAIFPNASKIDEKLFQSIARELNLSETVFLFPPQGSDNYSMRIFTPGKELPTAGHPTVGTAHFLTRYLRNPPEGIQKITIEQKIGPVDVYIQFKDNLPEMITMHQPLPVFGRRHDEKRELLAGILGLDISEMGEQPIQEVSCGNNTLLVPLKDVDSLSKIRLKTDQWIENRADFGNAMLYTYTLKGVKKGDIQGRMFAPEIGIIEDPATGSANGPLAAYLTEHQLLDMPAISLQGYEMGRPSQIYLDALKKDSGEFEKVTISGKCVYTGEGFHFLDLF